MKSKITIVLASVALLAVGCEPGSGTTTTGAAPKASAAASVDVASADIPVPEDFEEEAQSKVTEDNYEDQLAALEKEIEGDKE